MKTGGLTHKRTSGGFFPDKGSGISTVKSGGGTSFTSGAVLFGAADGKIDEDPTVLFWDKTNNRLGVGTNAPTHEVTVVGATASSRGLLVIGPNATVPGGAADKSELALYEVDPLGAGDKNMLDLYADGSVFGLRSHKTGAAVQRPITVGFLADAAFTETWRFQTAGHLITGLDNAYDIGASGATRPRTGYFGTSIQALLMKMDGNGLNQTGTNAGMDIVARRSAGDVGPTADFDFVAVNTRTAGNLLRLTHANGATAAFAIQWDGKLKLEGPTQTTVGAAGTASALPANPTGYIRFFQGGTERVIPFYTQV